ncbi:MAG: DUF3604 domain-containing protein, partial [Deltaproteobacteria bacterium]|nr:DUF3604 domain-containing protein [Deltaproteobacteria bacterium]
MALVKPPAVLLTMALAASFAGASDDSRGHNYSPPTRNDYPAEVFWGDTHLHTNLSPDAFSFGNRGVTPEQAYRFARGEVVNASNGISAQLQRPLDFLMVSDHAEFMGIFPRIYSLSPEIIDTPLGKRWGEYVKNREFRYVMTEFVLKSMDLDPSHIPNALKTLDPRLSPELLSEIDRLEVPPKLEHSIWTQVGEVADTFNDPGKFTAFIGYEWTSMPGGNNLHRNVLFRDDASKTSLVTPFSALDSSDPEDLWQFLARYEEETGGKVLAIPHNGNLSNGSMFAKATFTGLEFDKDYLQRRSRWEPIVEVTQIKGDGEAHPFLSPNDEFADYGTWDTGNLSGQPKQQKMLEFEYARSALKNGLAIEQLLGSNPYAFGMIGSTDAHTSFATADEDNFFGKMSNLEPAPGRVNKLMGTDDPNTPGAIKATDTLSSGYAAIWARENTREAL